jgi:hypothetical protein
MKGTLMKYRIIVVLIAFFSMISPVSADCLNDSYSRRVCGKGECKMSTYGKVYCAREGGGAANNKNDKVECGIGYCITDDYDRVWCSKVPWGKVTIDENGKMVCDGGCERGNTSYCEEGKATDDGLR